MGIPGGGWCPLGRRCEDGVIPAIYPLREAPTESYAERTRLNVRDSDMTLVIWSGDITPGSAMTVKEADRQGKPVVLLRLRARTTPEDPALWISERVAGVGVLNIAGPRESRWPGIYAMARKFLEDAFREFHRPVK